MSMHQWYLMHRNLGFDSCFFMELDKVAKYSNNIRCNTWLYAWVEIKTHPGVDQARAWLSETGQTGGTGRIIGSSDWFYLKEQISAKLAVGCLGLNFIWVVSMGKSGSPSRAEIHLLMNNWVCFSGWDSSSWSWYCTLLNAHHVTVDLFNNILIQL